MANLGLRVLSDPHPGRGFSPEYHISTTTSLNQQIQSWDSEILRAARARGVSYDATQDLVQAARIRLAEVLTKDRALPDRYLRRVIANAMHDEFRANRVIDDPVLDIHEAEDRQEAWEVAEVADETTLPSEAFFDAELIWKWTSKLSKREQQIVALLWIQDLTERGAAVVLGISKTRLHQLKDEIICRGRSDLIALAA